MVVNVGFRGLNRRSNGVVIVEIKIGFRIRVVVVELLFHLVEKGIHILLCHG